MKYNNLLNNTSLKACIIYILLIYNATIYAQGVPTLVAPPDIVVSCQFPVTVESLMDISNTQFGRIVFDLSNRRKVATYDIVCPLFCEAISRTYYPGYDSLAPPSSVGAPNKACNFYHSLFDPISPSKIHELAWGFDGYVLSNTKITVKVILKDERVCNQGRISRTFEVKDSGSNVTVRAKQTIWIVDCDPVNIPADCLKGTKIILNSCKDTLPSLDRPCLDQLSKNCGLITVEPIDEIHTGDPNSCFTIIRKWVIIDWCQHNPKIDLNFGKWETIDTIEVRDAEIPILSALMNSCNRIDSISQPGTPLIEMEIISKHTDNCTPEDWLTVEYSIDLFNDNSIDARVGPLSKTQVTLGEIPLHQNNTYAYTNKNPFDASGSYPPGIHTIFWTATDGCGNTAVQEFVIETRDIIPPRIYCFNWLTSIFEIPGSGKVDIFANKLLDRSSDNCTEAKFLTYYFNDDTSKTSLTYTCDDLKKNGVNNELLVDAIVTVEDLAGNKSYCDLKFSIRDANNDCNIVSTEQGKNGNDIAVFPNPFDQFIVLSSFQATRFSHYELLNFSGQKIIVGNVDTYSISHKIDIPLNVQSGIYFLKVYGANQVWLKRIIKS